MEFRSAARTDIGRRREQNQDAVLTDHPLYAVADGMGGHRAGEVASSLTLEILADAKQRVADEGPDVLPDIVLEANKNVFDRGREDPGLEGMGTTLTAAWIQDRTLTLAHVGDSRAYLMRGGTLSRLTEDQTLVAQWEKEGKIGPGEAERHPQRNILTQAIGTASDINVDVTSLDLVPGDRVLLSSDGLHSVLGDEERIRDILLGTDDPEEACQQLVDAANEAGGDDNITVLILDAMGTGGAAAAPPPVADQQDADEGAEDDRESTGPQPVIVSKPTAEEARPTKGSARKIALIAGVIGLVALIAVIAYIRSAEPGFFVGTDGRHVAILRGEPGSDDVEVVEVFEDIPLSTIARTYQRNLREGIAVGSRLEAERVVATLPRALGPHDTPIPTPSPPPGTPPPTPTASLPPTSPAP